MRDLIKIESMLNSLEIRQLLPSEIHKIDTKFGVLIYSPSKIFYGIVQTISIEGEKAFTVELASNGESYKGQRFHSFEELVNNFEARKYTFWMAPILNNS